MEEEQKPAEERTQVEQQKPFRGLLWRTCRHAPGLAVCIALLVLCLGVCVFDFVRTSEMQSRIVSLEQRQRDTQLSAMLSLEQVEPFILGRLDQILEEVSPVMWACPHEQHLEFLCKVIRLILILHCTLLHNKKYLCKFV